MSATAASDLLRAGHRKIEEHLDPFLHALLHLTPERVGEIRRHFEEIRRLAGPHFEKEEGVFYPRLRPQHPELLAQMDNEHETTRLTERYLGELLASLPEAPGERDLTELHRLGIEFHDAVQTHIVAEEDYLLELADQVLSESEQQVLRARMQEVSSAVRR
ncbi:MAG: hemerythrin domain-containing protein [Acidobacteria bacterium]|nr:hemerythrin domain-containing protein [Acidobacteriota bacterium]